MSAKTFKDFKAASETAAASTRIQELTAEQTGLVESARWTAARIAEIKSAPGYKPPRKKEDSDGGVGNYEAQLEANFNRRVEIVKTLRKLGNKAARDPDIIVD